LHVPLRYRVTTSKTWPFIGSSGQRVRATARPARPDTATPGLTRPPTAVRPSVAILQELSGQVVEQDLAQMRPRR